MDPLDQRDAAAAHRPPRVSPTYDCNGGDEGWPSYLIISWAVFIVLHLWSFYDHENPQYTRIHLNWLNQFTSFARAWMLNSPQKSKQNTKSVSFKFGVVLHRGKWQSQASHYQFNCVPWSIWVRSHGAFPVSPRAVQSLPTIGGPIRPCYTRRFLPIPASFSPPLRLAALSSLPCCQTCKDRAVLNAA